MSSQICETSSKRIKKILILMRHGEKLIKTGKTPKCGKFDSELSPLGINQAFLSSQNFLSQLKKYNFSNISPSEIHIISSPYMRTLQTTSYLLKGIHESKGFFVDKTNISSLYNISVDYGIREILNKNKLKGEEIPKSYLNFLNNPKYKEFDEELKKLNINLLINYDFPTEKENQDECCKRCEKYVEEQLINFDKDNKYKVILIVSHSGPMRCIMKKLGYYIKDVKDILIADQYYFDISDGIQNAKFLEKIGVN